MKNWGQGWRLACSFCFGLRGLLSSEAWRRGSLASLPGCLSGDRGRGQRQGQWAGADVVTETQCFCQFCVCHASGLGAVAQNETFWWPHICPGACKSHLRSLDAHSMVESEENLCFWLLYLVLGSLYVLPSLFFQIRLYSLLVSCAD